MATPSSAGTFQIVEGVRRSKAAHMLGRATIAAQIDDDGNLSAVLDVPLDLLRSPKDVIDVSTGLYYTRWLRVYYATQQGIALPPIIITRGGTGKALADVGFQY